MTITLQGILAPVTTPFGSDGDVDLAAFARNVRAHLAAGVDGIVVAGSTGEAPLLDDAERAALVGAARDTISAAGRGRRLGLLAGAGAESARETVRRARAAAGAGADAVLVAAPHYYSAAATPETRTRQLRAHYQHVADASPIPVVLYNIPKYMHFAIDPALVGELAAHANVIGIKDSSGDDARLASYLAAESDTFSVLTGSGAGLASALEVGARGGILAVALFAPALTLEVRAAHAAGDVARARSAQALLAPLAREVVGALGVPGVKSALDAVGLEGGDPRLPLVALVPTERARVAELLSEAGLLPLGQARRATASAAAGESAAAAESAAAESAAAPAP